MAYSESVRVTSSGKEGEASSFGDITASGGKGGYTVNEIRIVHDNDINISEAVGGKRWRTKWKTR